MSTTRSRRYLAGVKEVEVVPRRTPVWTPERLNQKAKHALEGSRNAMLFRTIKRRSLEAHEKLDRQRVDLPAVYPEAARGIDLAKPLGGAS